MLAEGVHPVSLERAATPGRLPGRAAAAQRRAQHGADGQDPQGDRGRGRARRRRPGRRTRPSAVIDDDDRARSPVAAQGRGLLRLRRERQAHGAVVRARRDVPGRRASRSRFADLKDRMLFIEALETAKCFEEGVIDVGRRGQHRLDHGHRLPGADRRRGAVHDRLQALDETGHGVGPVGLARSWRAPTSSPRRTATASARRRTSARWRRRASPSPPEPPAGSAAVPPAFVHVPTVDAPRAVQPTEHPRRRR